MDVAIVHFHLNRGGVTSVIANHLRSLERVRADVRRVVVLHGGRRDGWSDDFASHFQCIDVRTDVVDQLEYDSPRGPAGDIERDEATLAKQIEATLVRHGLRPDTTILHFHNHALGKNRATPGAIHRLSRDFRTLLQIHDFAEDLRPDVYQHLRASLTGDARPTLPHQLYPSAEGIHYGVLNRRDYAALLELGVPSERLHWLPNPVAPVGPLPDRQAARRRLDPRLTDQRCMALYPVRGIRRKNLGEFVLYAAVLRDSTTLALSLAPQNPAERTSYDRWHALARSLESPIHWDTGGRRGMSFLENLAASDVIVTTSVAEGFGMVFLEAWLAGRMLMGRDLPDITADFKAAGMRLHALGDALAVPVEWLSADVIRGTLSQSLRQLCDAYGLSSPPASEVDAELDQLLSAESIDFALLTPDQQADVIRRAAADRAAAEHLLERNHQLLALREHSPGAYEDVVNHNARIVRREYDFEAFGARLQQSYQSLASASPGAAPEPPASEAAILRRFVRLSRLHPVRFQ